MVKGVGKWRGRRKDVIEALACLKHGDEWATGNEAWIMLVVKDDIDGYVLEELLGQ